MESSRRVNRLSNGEARGNAAERLDDQHFKQY